MSYGLYIAKIVGVCTSSDSRLQIQILPQMSSLDTTICPKWPFFFKDEAFTGKYGDLVWCICDDEFNNGFVLGLANFGAYGDDYYETYNLGSQEIPLSIPNENLQEKISSAAVELLGQRISFQDIKVTHWNETSIHFVERSTGGFIVAFAVGSLLIMRPSEFFVHIGSEASGSSLKINSEGLSMAGDSIKLQSEEVNLGKHPTGNVMVTNGTSSEGALTSSYVKA